MSKTKAFWTGFIGGGVGTLIGVCIGLLAAVIFFAALMVYIGYNRIKEDFDQ